ncbi:hypothetical protein BC829DRAFT_488626 [Chytridium lagenaria]|nr:hypothetical protein BC829DRAFT_488626 [Chytridium lagenaria]
MFRTPAISYSLSKRLVIVTFLLSCIISTIHAAALHRERKILNNEGAGYVFESELTVGIAVRGNVSKKIVGIKFSNNTGATFDEVIAKFQQPLEGRPTVAAPMVLLNDSLVYDLASRQILLNGTWSTRQDAEAIPPTNSSDTWSFAVPVANPSATLPETLQYVIRFRPAASSFSIFLSTIPKRLSYPPTLTLGMATPFLRVAALMLGSPLFRIDDAAFAPMPLGNRLVINTGELSNGEHRLDLRVTPATDVSGSVSLLNVSIQFRVENRIKFLGRWRPIPPVENGVAFGAFAAKGIGFMLDGIPVELEATPEVFYNASSAKLNSEDALLSVSVNKDGKLFALSPNAYKIVSWKPDGSINKEFGEAGILSFNDKPYEGKRFCQKTVLTVVGDNVILSDSCNRRIVKFDASGKITGGTVFRFEPVFVDANGPSNLIVGFNPADENAIVWGVDVDTLRLQFDIALESTSQPSDRVMTVGTATENYAFIAFGNQLRVFDGDGKNVGQWKTVEKSVARSLVRLAPAVSVNPADTVPPTNDPNNILDLLVVGAGPHALSLLSHLLERSPYAVLNDAEHQRYHSQRQTTARPSSTSSPLRQCCPVLDPEVLRQRVMVLDACGGWMEKWNSAFKAYEISHLRSPLFFHPDPFHPDSLRTFAESEGRKSELLDITHVVDTGCKKCKRKASETAINSSPQALNSFATFASHSWIAPDASSTANPQDLDSDSDDDVADPSAQPPTHIFAVTYAIASLPTSNCLTTTIGSSTERTITVYARKVVTALGNTNIPSIPQWASQVLQEDSAVKQERLKHALDLLKNGKIDIPGDVAAKIKNKKKDRPVRLLVVGGGLTSAQLADVGVKRKFDEVVLISRSKLRTMPFDLSLEWVGRNSMIHHTKFWGEKDPESPNSHKARRQMLTSAKNGGGSITPEYMSILQRHASSSRLQIREKTEVTSIAWTSSGTWCVEFSQGSPEEFDLIWLGTGSILDVTREPCLAKVMEEEARADLQWPGLNLHMMSGYSALTIGPSAGNLHGGRIASQRIASVLWSQWRLELLHPCEGRIPIAACLVDGYCPWHPFDGETGRKVTGRKPNLRTLANMSGHFGNYWEALEVE